jgi:hypothetical protein
MVIKKSALPNLPPGPPMPLPKRKRHQVANLQNLQPILKQWVTVAKAAINPLLKRIADARRQSREDRRRDFAEKLEHGGKSKKPEDNRDQERL